ncbi:MAG: ATP-binding protein [Candidatus Margulisiibacteriota bacterium]
MGSWFTLIFVAFTTYSITKHNLLDISIVISRFFAELLTIALYVSIYLGLVWMFKSTSRETVNWLFILMTIAMGILVGQTHQTIRLFIQTTSDKLFLRGKYNYYKELSDATTRVGEKMSLAEILKVLYSTFNNVIEISNPRIFLPEYFSDNEKSSKAYVIYDKASFQPLMSDLSVLLDAKWLKTLIDNRVPMYEVKEIDAFLVVPCFVEERLIGFFALGRKLSEDAYTDEDLRLLRALANQAGMALDHTRSYEKIRADLELVERQLERSQRLASLGTLTAGVTHEIRNPLTVIRGETERLLNQPRDTEYLANFRDLLLKHIDRISGIVNRMLDLAKEKPKQKIAVDLNELINSTLPLLSLGPIKVTTELTASQSINGDPEALQEVIINLLQNAIDSMPHGGQLSIKTYQENNRTVVEINDTGKGIPLEIREKIFDPFFSSRHEGVGLGLSIAYRIVREHDGDISVTSEVGKGSTFKLEF